MKVVLNGELIDAADADLLPGDWPKGSGVFETLRAEGQETFALHRHHCRAKEAAEFEIALEETITTSVNQLLASQSYPVSRLRICFGEKGDWLITNHPYTDPEPAKLMVFKERNHDNKVRKKRYPYVRNISLNQDAVRAGFDDGILISKNGEVAETSFTNLFLEINGQWLTPPLTSGILNGVIRAIAIEEKCVAVAPITLKELENAKRGLMISSLRIAQEISEIDGRKLGSAATKRAQIWELIEGFRGF